MEQNIYEEYTRILHEEIVPALGCTEPIAIAYGAAKAREILGTFPEKILVCCSGNIVKNVKAVIVPTTGNMRGIEASAVLGAVGGDASLKLQVLSNVSSDDIALTRKLLKQKICRVELLDGVPNLMIKVEMEGDGHTSMVEIEHAHTNIVRIERDGECLQSKDESPEASYATDRSMLNLENIYDYACTVELDELMNLLDKQVASNLAIAAEGLKEEYGCSVGATLLRHYGNDVYIRAKALPAAGSDARMNGCVMPVVINCGSGNQGLTVSLPVQVFAEELKVSEEARYRALILSNLVAIYQKNVLGKLSAYCGAVSAAVGAGAGIAMLHGYGYEIICKTIVNTLASVSGIVCDGAKSSCAAKIAASVDAAILAFEIARDGKSYRNGEGLVKQDAERTIQSFGRMGREGMRSTDLEILQIMLED